MLFRITPSRRRFNRITLNMTSMIDVTFLLLAYFMVTMVLSSPEDRLSSSLHARTEPAAGPRSDFQPQIVEVLLVNDTPAYRLGARILPDQASLFGALDPLNKDTGIFIKVMDGPSVEFVMGAFQAAHDADFDKVTYVVPE